MKTKLIRVTLLKTRDSLGTQYRITKIVNAVTVGELEVGDWLDTKLATELSEQRDVEVTVVS
jgi:hypothetical protein